MRTDTELLDYLQRLNDENQYTGRCILRLSGNGRGWRLHETCQANAVNDVRKAIDDYIDINESLTDEE